MDDEAFVEDHPAFNERWSVSWLRAPFQAQLPLRAEAFCVTSDGLVVLVQAEGAGWTMPGGRLEPGETPEEALVREIGEEACAVVEDMQYLGCWQVTNLDTADQRIDREAAYWARIRLEPFDPRFEVTARREVTVAQVGGLLDVPAGTERLVANFIEQAMAVEHERRPSE